MTTPRKTPWPQALLLPLLAALASAGVLLGGCDVTPRMRRCEQMKERYAELLATQGRDDMTHHELVRMREQAKKIAARHPFFEGCAEELADSVFECSQRAQDPTEFERCLP